MPPRGSGGRDEKPVKITRVWQSGGGPNMLYMCWHCRGSDRCNYVVICRVDGTCGQRPSCVQRCLPCFLSFPHASPPLPGGGPKRFFHRGPNALSAALFIIYSKSIEGLYYWKKKSWRVLLPFDVNVFAVTTTYLLTPWCRVLLEKLTGL